MVHLPIKKQYYKKEVLLMSAMQLLRKKFLAILVIAAAIVALLNSSVQLAAIIQLFPDIDISYALAEELIETAEDNTEKGVESSLALDLIFTGSEFILHNRNLGNSMISFFHRIQLPPHPYFNKFIPPPEV